MSSEPGGSDACKVCSERCDPYENPAVRCQGECQRQVHVCCLQRGALPSNLMGDVFYDLYCSACSGEELLVRQKLPWLTTLVLTLYNLREKSYGTSRRGYFHWKSDISIFISNNWDTLYNKTTKKKKNWIGTISGGLSHFSTEFFQSGTSELQEQGWWKLKDKDPPEVLINNYNKMRELKKLYQSKNKLKPVDNINIKKEIYSNSNNFNSVSTCEEYEDDLDMDIDMANIDKYCPSFKLVENTVVEALPFLNGNEISDLLDSNCFEYEREVPGGQQHENIDVFNISSSENSQDLCTIKMEYDSEESNDQKYSNENSKSNDLPPPPPSLFTQSDHKPCLWDEPSNKITPDRIKPLMTERQEEYLLQKIEKYKHLLDTAPVTVRRLYRKLKVRKEKRQLGLPMFNIDTFGKNLNEKTLKDQNKNNVLDRFMIGDVNTYFEVRLQGPTELTPIYIPDIDRILHPLISKHESCSATWLKVMDELLTKVNGKKRNSKLDAIVNFSYARPQHIPAMNSLCSQFFWPGIDLTECLQYPHTTCVALYKKLVIGFGIMVPDVSFNEAYISHLLVRPEWRRAGIGTYMLYHLTQTVWTKDITLHVSTTNPAMSLYTKFGFQIEDCIHNFYDKYIPPSSKESKDAFFLRMT